MDRIKVGQIGICHEHAAGKMNTLRLRPDVFEVVGVVDDRATMSAKFAGDDLGPYDGLPWLTEEELFAVPGLQAVLVEVPNQDLVPTAARCLERRLPIHMDKPGGEDLSAFERMRRGYEALRLPFQMGYMFRGNPAMHWILEAARKGYFGEIHGIRADMSHNYGGDAYQDYIGRFAGGVMFNLGCHLLDWIIALMGRPAGVAPFLKSTPEQPDRVKNNTLAVLEYPHALATVDVCSRQAGHRRLKVCGARGTAELCPQEDFSGQPLRLELLLVEGNDEFAAGSHTVDFGETRDRYEEHLLEWARMVRGEIPNPHDARHDCLVQEVLLAASGYAKWEFMPT